jgi:hypothetical protein
VQHRHAPPVVYLHVGPPKSGTTFLQSVLWHNRAALARDGVLYAARHPNDHFRAAQDLRGIHFQGYADPFVRGAWRRVVRRAHRWHGRAVIISHELLAAATEEQVHAAADSLLPAQVHVIYAARDLARQIPAMWQESVKNGRVLGFQPYLRSLRAPGGPRSPGGRFWRDQDAVGALARWGQAIPPERMHVVTVPPPGGARTLLWHRFADVLGVDPARYDSCVGRGNVSLGAAEAELLRRVNRALDGRLRWPAYGGFVKDGFTTEILAERLGAAPIALPPRWRPWVLERARRLVADLRESGYDVVGDLDELIDDTTADVGESPAPNAESQLDAAADALATVLLARSRDRAVRWRRGARAAPRWARETAQDLAIRRAPEGWRACSGPWISREPAALRLGRYPPGGGSSRS